MTDKNKEIIKALECCACGSCTDCPMHNSPSCHMTLIDGCFEIYNQQQAEIKALKEKHMLNLLTQIEPYRKLKAEAIKEFTNKFKQRCIDGGIFPAYVNRQLELTLKEVVDYTDTIYTGTIEQIKWERDTAIQQLESYGVGFCEQADVVKVKHGYWKWTGSCQICSCCNEEQPGFDSGRYYCPYCGAKMDGKDN